MKETEEIIINILNSYNQFDSEGDIYLDADQLIDLSQEIEAAIMLQWISVDNPPKGENISSVYVVKLKNGAITMAFYYSHDAWTLTSPGRLIKPSKENPVVEYMKASELLKLPEAIKEK